MSFESEKSAFASRGVWGAVAAIALALAQAVQSESDMQIVLSAGTAVAAAVAAVGRIFAKVKIGRLW